MLRAGGAGKTRVSGQANLRLTYQGYSTTAFYFYNPADNASLIPDTGTSRKGAAAPVTSPSPPAEKAPGCVAAGPGPLCNCSAYDCTLLQVLRG